MRSEGLAGGQHDHGAGLLPLTVATVYFGMAAVATLVALLASQPVAFLPLILLSFPFGFLLLNLVDTSSLVLQSLFVAAGIGINAWLAALIAAAVTAAGHRGRHRRR
jgi:hypothetical protein